MCFTASLNAASPVCNLDLPGEAEIGGSGSSSPSVMILTFLRRVAGGRGSVSTGLDSVGDGDSMLSPPSVDGELGAAIPCSSARLFNFFVGVKSDLKEK